MKLHIIHFKGHFTLSEIFPLVIWQGFCFSFFKKIAQQKQQKCFGILPVCSIHTFPVCFIHLPRVDFLLIC